MSTKSNNVSNETVTASISLSKMQYFFISKNSSEVESKNREVFNREVFNREVFDREVVKIEKSI